ncbi:MAG: FkbM family methyltransferase [Pseudomonadota bacterium]
MNNAQLNWNKRESRDDWGQHFEMMTARLYCTFIQPGDVVIDGGANAGMHTIPLAKRVGQSGKVIAVEPQAECISDLRRWLAKERLTDRVDVHQGVLADKNGIEDFWINTDNNAMSARAIDSHSLAISTRVEVSAYHIDELKDDRRVGFIKLDVEGGEYHALLGAKDTLTRDRPLIVFENGGAATASVNGYEVSDFTGLFEMCGYEVYDFMGSQVGDAQFNAPDVFPWYFLAGHKTDPKLQQAKQLCIDYFMNVPKRYADWQGVINDIYRWSKRKH